MRGKAPLWRHPPPQSAGSRGGPAAQQQAGPANAWVSQQQKLRLLFALSSAVFRISWRVRFGAAWLLPGAPAAFKYTA